tara:strand:- start:13750 stop:14178 length:429 start_codon:yes stop_codon:yes gene_type:complete
MAKIARLRLWDDSPENNISRDVIIETKLNDFGNPLCNKSILGFFINFTQGSTNHIFNWSIWYRKSTKHPYIYLTSFSNYASSGSTDTSQSHYYAKYIDSPFELYTMQLKIEGNYVQGNAGINDFGVIYREHREVQVDKFDEV